MIRNTFAVALVAGSLVLTGAALTSAAVAGQTGAAAGSAATAPAQPAATLPAATVLEQLGTQGYRDFTDVELDDGRYEVEGRDAEGREVELDVDARTGSVLKVEND